LTRQQTRILTWTELNPTIRDITDVESLDSTIKELGALDSLLLRIEPILDTEIGGEVVQGLQVLKEELEERAFLVEWHDDPSAFANLGLTTYLPDGILQRVDEALSTVLEGRTPEDLADVFAGKAGKTVQEARTLLHSVARGEHR